MSFHFKYDNNTQRLSKVLTFLGLCCLGGCGNPICARFSIYAAPSGPGMPNFFSDYALLHGPDMPNFFSDYVILHGPGLC